MWADELGAASDEVVLTALLSGRAGVAGMMLSRFGSLTRLLGASPCSLETIEGLGPEGARTITACRILAERALREQVANTNVISSWSSLLSYVRLALAGAPREQLRVLFLDKKNALIADERMGEGTVDHAPVYPREIMRRALELGGSALILVHNHPSGDPTPSAQDIEITRQVVEAGRWLKIGVHDHIVVGVQGVASFKALGLL